jgi:hypothetical protein
MVCGVATAPAGAGLSSGGVGGLVNAGVGELTMGLGCVAIAAIVAAGFDVGAGVTGTFPLA